MQLKFVRKMETGNKGVDIEVELAKKGSIPVALAGTVGGRSSEYAFELLKQGKCPDKADNER